MKVAQPMAWESVLVCTILALLFALAVVGHFEFSPREIAKCVSHQEWCAVEKPRLYEAIYGKQ